mgnify:CR=1 FL=1
MSQSKNYFLVGPMGAGKTAVGRQLAKLLKYEFIDSDEEIELRTGPELSTFDVLFTEKFREPKLIECVLDFVSPERVPLL